ncbi:hypothetical protein [Gemmatimonas sp.]|uniref:hypothetical protein n=1 Tax=Gemmatimonas sp. TaxID=1962908 RepID=UPI0025C53F77|nr:hypothetical protein [Gemmatimonas sp.]MCA2992073.1 hypothetical protein [Gemmatimonas sp.]
MSTRTTEFAAAITGDASSAIAALEKVKVRVQDTAKAAESANEKTAKSFELTVDKAQKAAAGVTGLSQALFALEAEGSTRVLALGAAVGNFAELFGPAGALVTGVGVAGSAIVALFLQAKEKAAEATKAIEEDIARLVNAGDFATLTKKLQEIEQGTAGAGFADGRAAARARIQQLSEEVLLAGKSNRFYLERQKAITEEKRKLAELTKEYDRYFKALTDPRNAPSAPRGLAGQPFVVTADRVGKTTEKAVKAKEDLDDAIKKFDDAFAKSLFATQAAIAEAGREIEEQQAKLRAALDAETAERVAGNDALQQEITARLAGADAYEAYLLVRTQDAAVAEAERRAKEAGIVLLEGETEAIRAQVAERLRLQRIVEAIKEVGDNPFSLPTSEDLSRVGQLADDLAKVAGAASGIAAAFGEAGAQMAALLTQSGALFSNLSRVQRAGIFTDANGQEQNAGLRGALRGDAGTRGQVEAVSGLLGAFGAGVSIVRGFAAASQAAGEAAAAAAIALRELGQQAISQARSFSLQASGTPLERELAGLESQFRGIIKALLEAGAPVTPGLGQRTAVSTRPTAAQVDKAIADYEKLVAAAKRAAEFAARQAELTDDARLLAAQGRTAEAEALRQLAADEKELEEARLAGADVAKKVAIQEAERAQREAQRLREQQKVRDDVTARRQTLAGDERGAFVTRQQSFAANAIKEAEALFAAGTITAELFADLKAVIGDELAAAIEDFDAAAAAATKRVQDDIAVRMLEAQGRTKEAASLRRQLEQQDQLAAAADETTRLQLTLLFALEEAAIAAAEALEEAAEARDAARGAARARIDLFDLDGLDAVQETINGYGAAFSGLFKSFDLTTLEGITAAKNVLRGIFTELAGLTDEQILQRFGMTREEVTAALLDTDAGLDGLASALGDVASAALEAAEAAAEFAESVNQDFLQSTGQGKQAQLNAAATKRNNRIKQAQQLGLGADVIAQIEAIYKADVAEIEARYAIAVADARAEASPSLGGGGVSAAPAQRRGNTAVVGDFGGLSEITAQSLAGLLREIAINTSARGAVVEAILGRGAPPSLASLRFPAFPTGGSVSAGTIVNIGPITVHVGGIAADGATPAAAGSMVAREIAAQLGRLATQEVRFLGSGVA